MNFFGKLWAVIRGIFIGAGDNVVSSSPEAIRATYATAIDEAKRRYKDMEKAVALLAREREKTEMSLKELQREELETQRKLDGSLASAEAEPENPAHREAGARYISRIKGIGEKQTKLTEDLETQKNKVEEYKMKLRSFTDEIEKLKKEQGEMVAELVSNQQVVQLEDRLRGLGETSVDESIVAIREKVAGLRHRAKIAAEMRGAALESQDAAYERLGAEREAAARFDELLKARAAAKVGAPTKERDLG
jgi:phage shock protein A